MQHNTSSQRDYHTGWTDSRSPKRSSRGLLWALLGSASGLAIGLFSLSSFDANALRVNELTTPLAMHQAAAEHPDSRLKSAVAETRQVDIPPPQIAAPAPVKGLWHDVTVREGDSLAHIFSLQNIPAKQLHRLITSSRTAKKLTHIYPGQTLRLRTTKEDGLLELVYKIDALNQIQVEREGNDFHARLVTRSPERHKIQATGEIDSSLFLAAHKAQLPENITMELAGIFGWDIDFALDIRKGDRFTVVYEELYLDGERIGTGDILAAEFINRGKAHQAVRYTDARGHTDYYSPEGRSMRKTFLRTPVAFSRISSRFSLGRRHPILNTIRSHKGVDYAAPRGTPVKATGSGRIVWRGRKGGYGNAIVIQHGSRYSTLYAHLNNYARGLHSGSRVQQGQVIGYVGSTGLATGPHLHYEFRINGVHRNPLTVKLPDAAPLKRTYLADFKLKTGNLLARLELARRQAIALKERTPPPCATFPQPMAEYYLGLMSGTSMDGIDAALVDLQNHQVKLLHARTVAWPDPVHRQLTRIVDHPEAVSLHALGQLDARVGETFAAAAQSVIQESGVSPDEIRAIGSHGQTLFHAPESTPAFSYQCGDPNRIAEITGITTVADFRRRDIAAGGQGAPLVPAFHQARFAATGQPRAVLNLGGMANLTLLPGDDTPVSGFDTGPGNVLMDVWYGKYHAEAYDHNGAWAKGGECYPALLEILLEHPFLKQAPPKSTGREVFCGNWLDAQLERLPTPPDAVDVQRTLLEFTLRTICDAVTIHAANTRQILVCGGGIHNSFLMQRLNTLLDDIAVTSTEAFGLHPDWVEAVAFAWLAKQTLNGQPGNVPSVTGASHPVVLGAVYLA